MNINYRLVISCILTTLVAVQSTTYSIAASQQASFLGNYFARLKRGIECYRKGTPCSKEDKATVQRTIITIVTLLLVGTAGVGGYWITKVTDGEKKKLFQAITTPDMTSIEDQVTTLERHWKRIPFHDLLLKTFKQLSEKEHSRKDGEQKRNEFSRHIPSKKTKKPKKEKHRKNEQHIDFTKLAPQVTESYIRISQTSINREKLAKEQEQELIKIAQFFIQKIGPHTATNLYENLEEQTKNKLPGISKVKIDAKTLQKLGILQ